MAGRKTKKRNNWIKRHLSDGFVKQANQSGYVSRAVYKLEQIDTQDRLLRPGMAVLDIGAAPGSWSQYVYNKVGKTGKVVAVDLLPIRIPQPVICIQGDCRDQGTQQQIAQTLVEQQLDLVICDIAPNITGIDDLDQARMLELLEMVLIMTRKWLKPGGHFVVKVFSGSAECEFRKLCKPIFKQLSVRKPSASRAKSREFYFVARGFRPKNWPATQ